MKQEYENRMREFEDCQESYLLPETYIVARLDGRGFSSLTQEMGCKKPFDENFFDIMSKIIEKIIKDSGFNIIYGYLESDEISLLFKPKIYNFGRRLNKYITILSSLSSSIFTKETNIICSFDCRISQLPSVQLVCDYFQWRQLDATRNCLNSYAYYILRENLSKKECNKVLYKMNASDLNDLLFRKGINFNDIACWQKRGCAFYWKEIEKEGQDPRTGENKIVKRKILFKDNDLLYGKEYNEFIKKIIDDNRPS